MSVATQPFTGTYIVDPVHSSVLFAVRHMRVSIFRASFGDLEAHLVADEDGLRLTGAAPVESVSIKSPKEFRDHVVYGSDFFDAGNHPQISVRSTDIVLGEDGAVTAHGELTIRGVTRPVTAIGSYQPPVEDPFGSRRAAVELTATVDRRDWGLDWQAPLPDGGDGLGYQVEISAHLELVKEV